MKLVIHAVNVHQGGGRTLLLALLSALRRPAIVMIDERLAPLPELDPGVRIVRVAPRVSARLNAERQLHSLCGDGDTLLCFGNLPPLWSSSAQVFVYLHNRYLSSPRPLAGLPWDATIRLHLERLWLRFCLRDARLLVQTESMAEEVLQYLGRKAHVLPFVPRLDDKAHADGHGAAAREHASSSGLHDYVYVASGEPHKNHRRLLGAWRMLAARNCFPSLQLTLDEQREPELLAWIRREAQEHKLRISSAPVTSEQVPALYKNSKALIYPSLFESFGLPMLEAHAAGLEIVASERDFVRDVVVPVQTFDPDSALSISRAVLRHLEQPVPRPQPLDAAGFLQELDNLRE